MVQVLLFAGYFSQLPKELEEAALVDGAGFLRIFARSSAVGQAGDRDRRSSSSSCSLELVPAAARADADPAELQTLAVGVYAFQSEYFSDWSGMAAAATTPCRRS